MEIPYRGSLSHAMFFVMSMLVLYYLRPSRRTDRAITHEAILTLRHEGVDGIILGCTEIPLLLQGEADMPDLLNPAQVLAEATVRYALE